MSDLLYHIGTGTYFAADEAVIIPNKGDAACYLQDDEIESMAMADGIEYDDLRIMAKELADALAEALRAWDSNIDCQTVLDYYRKVWGDK